MALLLMVSSCKKGGKKSKSDWMISVTIDGVTHKAEGTVDNSMYGYNNNGQNYAMTPAYTQSGLITFNLTDKSHSSYVSGDNFNLTMQTTNLSSGLNYFFLNSTGHDIYNGLNLASATISTSGDYVFPITITDLGTPTTIANSSDLDNYYNLGDPIRGNGSAVLTDGNVTATVSIEFIAVRYY